MKKIKTYLELENDLKEANELLKNLNKKYKDSLKDIKELKKSHNLLQGLIEAGTVEILESSMNNPDEKWQWPTEENLLNLKGYSGL